MCHLRPARLGANGPARRVARRMDHSAVGPLPPTRVEEIAPTRRASRRGACQYRGLGSCVESAIERHARTRFPYAPRALSRRVFRRAFWLMLCVVQLRGDDFYRGPIVDKPPHCLRPSVETEQTGCLRAGGQPLVTGVSPWRRPRRCGASPRAIWTDFSVCGALTPL